jgi:hypothetical protein
MGKSEGEIYQEVAKKFTIEGIINLPTEKDILSITRSNNPTEGDVWKHKGQVIPETQVKVLQEQAQTFLNSNLWKVLEAELLWQAQERGLVKAQTTVDMITGKSLIYMTDVINTKLKAMAHKR